MAKTYELTVETRSDQGKGASRRLRRLADKVPGIIYGGGQPAVSVSVDHKKLLHALENEAFYSHILTIDVDGKKEKAVLKDLQRHPSKPRVLHMDLLRITGKEKIHMRIPLHFTGGEEAPGVKDGEGVISHLISDVEVICLPDNLPEFISLDISHLELGQSLHLSDLRLPKGVELALLAHGHDNDVPVVNIHVPRKIEEEVVAAPESAEVPVVGEEGAEAAPTDETAEKGGDKGKKDA